jgi:LysR family transcriptional regulator, nitrogen assimilation regulatory protein
MIYQGLEMDARSLRYFQAVVEFGSYSKASRFLRISQPAISRQVGRLEKELGKPLLVRTGHGAAPTDAGRLLSEHAQAILRQIENAAVQVRNIHADPTGSVALAVPPGAGAFLVPELVNRFSAAFPNVMLRIAAGFSGYIHEALVHGRVDVACLHAPMPQRDFAILPLIAEEVFLVGKRSKMPRGRTAVRIVDLADLPLILPSGSHSSRRLLDELASEQGVALNIACEVDDPSLIRGLLRQGIGYSLLSQGGFQYEAERGELASLSIRPRLSWPLALMLSESRPRTKPVDALIDTIRAIARDLTTNGSWPGKLLDRQA